MTVISRRRFLAHGSWAMASAAFAATAMRPSSSWATTAATDAYTELDGVALAELLKNGEVTPQDLLEITIKRIERLNPKINAVVTRCYDRARSRANDGTIDGPFAGVPLLVKDLHDVEGVRTTYGCRARLNNIATATGPYTKACEDAGFNILGKTNTPEFGQMGTTESLALGPCYNPWDLTRSSGGSSGGAGAAVAAGIVPIATASDGGGSIRIPASCCGVFGLKVSRGRLKGANPLFSVSVKGVLSRTVRDTAHVLAHTERKQSGRGMPEVGLVNGPAKRRLKIGMTLKGGKIIEPENDVREAIESTAAMCEALGHEVRPFNMKFDGEALADDFLTLWSSIAGTKLQSMEEEFGRKITLQDLEPLTFGFAKHYANGGKEKVSPAIKRLLAVVKKIQQQMEPYDVVLSPVLGSAPPEIGYHSPTVPFDVVMERMSSYVAYTPIFNVAGMPAMSVPLHWNDSGLPIGSHFSAKVGDEATLLSLAYELEAAHPWANKWPSCSIAASR